MSDFILLQNYARNFLLRFFMAQDTTLDVEPGYRGELEVITTGWRGTVKVIGREKSGRSLLVDPRWAEEDATVLAVYLLDSGMVWLIDAPKLYALVARNVNFFESRYNKRVVPWTAIAHHIDGKCMDIRGLDYLSFEQYRSLHA